MTAYLDENGLKTFWEKLKTVIAATKVVAHADSTSEWGQGGEVAYGHVKLNSAIDSTLNANDGTGAVPFSVKQFYDTGKNLIAANRNARNTAIADITRKINDL